MIFAALFFAAAALCLVGVVEHRHKIFQESTLDLRSPRKK